MEATNLVEKVLDRVDAMDVDGFLSFLADVARLRFSNGPAIAGKEQIGQAISEFFQSIKALRHKILHIWSDAQGMVCQGEVSYTRSDGAAVCIPFINVWGVQDGLIKDYLIYIDLAPLYA